MPYPDFIMQAQNMPPTVPPVLVNTDFSTMNRNHFKNCIPQISNMNDYDIMNLIKNFIQPISQDILASDGEYAPLLRDARFISIFIRAIESMDPKTIDYNTKLACNKIAYDYRTSDNPDPVITKQYLYLAKIINKDHINSLLTISLYNHDGRLLRLDEDTASELALARYSSSNERANAKRFNFVMYFRDPEIMNEQMVVYIIEKLFTHISPLFYATMFEVYTSREQDDYGDNFMEVYGTVGLAVLLILNNMTTDNIRKVLIGYANEWEYFGRPSTRFSLHALSNDYAKTTGVVERLTSEGIMIP